MDRVLVLDAENALARAALAELIDDERAQTYRDKMAAKGAAAPTPEEGRPAPLLLYDLWSDPDCLNSLHDEKPDLVRKYSIFLNEQWETHQALASQFERSDESPLSPEQLETLRSLGYIQ